MGILGSIIILLGYPLLCGYLLWRARHDSERLKMAWMAFTTEGYTTRLFFWDIVLLFRNFLIIVVRFFAGKFQFLGFMLIMSGWLLVVGLLRPHCSSTLQTLEILLSLLCVSLLTDQKLNPMDDEISVSYWVFFLVCSMCTVLSRSWIFYRDYKNNIRKTESSPLYVN